MQTNKKLHVIEFKLKKLLAWGLFGKYKSKVSWSWMEFDEHKNYSPWDNVRDIDWKASSKTNELYVKKYEQDKDLKVLFCLDISSSMNFGSEEKTKKETLIETFYALALSAYYNNDNVWAIIFDENNLEFLDYKKEKTNIYKIVENIPLAPFQKGEQNKKPLLEGVGDVLNEIKNRRIKNNLIFIITDKEKFDLKKLKFLREFNDIIVLNIFDRFENELLNSQEKDYNFLINKILSNISFESKNKFLNVDLSDKEKIEDYKKLRKQKLEELKYNLEKSNIWYIFLDDKTDILKELIKYFK